MVKESSYCGDRSRQCRWFAVDGQVFGEAYPPSKKEMDPWTFHSKKWVGDWPTLFTSKGIFVEYFQTWGLFVIGGVGIRGLDSASRVIVASKPERTA